MRLPVSPADTGSPTCKKYRSWSFPIRTVPSQTSAACILDYYNNIHPGLKAGSGKDAAGRCSRLLPLQQFSENINPCMRHFAGSLMISGSIFKGWGWVLRSTCVSRGNVSNLCRALTVSSLDSSSYHLKRIRSMGSSCRTYHPHVLLRFCCCSRKNSAVIEPERKHTSTGLSCPIRLAFA